MVAAAAAVAVAVAVAAGKVLQERLTTNGGRAVS